MTINLKGVYILITGASRGIGKAIAETLAEQGATVIGTVGSDEKAELAAARRDDAGGFGTGPGCR